MGAVGVVGMAQGKVGAVGGRCSSLLTAFVISQVTCPKCAGRLGSFDWAGKQIGCVWL